MSQNMPKDRPDDVRLEPVAVSVQQAAQMTGICPKNMYALVAFGNVPAFRLRKKILIPVDGLRTWVNQQAIAN